MVEKTLNSTEYLNIVVDQLHLYMASAFPSGNGMVQQEDVPSNKARFVLLRFQEHDLEYQVMS